MRMVAFRDSDGNVVMINSEQVTAALLEKTALIVYLADGGVMVIEGRSEALEGIARWLMIGGGIDATGEAMPISVRICSEDDLRVIGALWREPDGWCETAERWVDEAVWRYVAARDAEVEQLFKEALGDAVLGNRLGEGGAGDGGL